jgi:hypothetical protein
MYGRDLTFIIYSTDEYKDNIVSIIKDRGALWLYTKDMLSSSKGN